MTDPASAEKIVDDLRRVGIRVSLDDFGTGQSSLGRLREFHFDKLKIDRAFVSSILDDRPSEHIIRAILAMCEGLGMEVVAEGIEDEAQAERLVQFGCGGGQGLPVRPAGRCRRDAGLSARNLPRRGVREGRLTALRQPCGWSSGRAGYASPPARWRGAPRPPPRGDP